MKVLERWLVVVVVVYCARKKSFKIERPRSKTEEIKVACQESNPGIGERRGHYLPLERNVNEGE